MAFLMARHLESRQLILLKGVITTLAPSFDRARLARGSLDLLGLHHVPVGKGTDGGDIHGEHTAAPFEVSAASYMSPPDGAIELGRGLLLRLYREATPGSLVLVVIASCKDAALFLRDHQGLFLEKTKEVIIQGGVKDVDWASSDLASVELQPDSANNNTFDVKASDYLYSQCQQLGVPLTIASRYAAYAAKMPRSVYDLLALTGSPIGWRLRNAQRASIEQLWARACATAPEKRKGLPARCNREWFAKTFCSGRDDPRRTEDDAVWDLVDGFMQVRAPPPPRAKMDMAPHPSPLALFGSAHTPWPLCDPCVWRVAPQYDTMALLVAVPSLRSQFFDPLVLPPKRGSVPSPHGASANRAVIGLSDKRPGVRQLAGLNRLLREGFANGLELNHRPSSNILLQMHLRWDNLADILLTCVMLRSLMDMGLARLYAVVITLDSTPQGAAAGQPAAGSAPPYLGKRLASLQRFLQPARRSGTKLVHPGSAPEAQQQQPSAAADGQAGVDHRLVEEVRQVMHHLGLGHVALHVATDATTASERLHQLYLAAPPTGLTLVATSTFGGLTPFAREHPQLFREKTVRVVHTGGALIEDGRRLVPDPKAQNNALDLPAAEGFYRIAQELSVPMVIISRHVARPCRVPRQLFDLLLQHGAPPSGPVLPPSHPHPSWLHLSIPLSPAPPHIFTLATAMSILPRPRPLFARPISPRVGGARRPDWRKDLPGRARLPLDTVVARLRRARRPGARRLARTLRSRMVHPDVLRRGGEAAPRRRRVRRGVADGAIRQLVQPHRRHRRDAIHHLQELSALGGAGRALGDAPCDRPR